MINAKTQIIRQRTIIIPVAAGMIFFLEDLGSISTPLPGTVGAFLKSYIEDVNSIEIFMDKNKRFLLTILTGDDFRRPKLLGIIS
jgi:hypothetical protein